MLKTFLTLLISVLTATLSYSQTCEQIKAENIRLKAELAKLKAEKSTPISSFKPVIETSSGIDFNVVSVVGNRKEQTVSVIILVTNHNANFKAYNTSVKSFIGSEGDEFKLESAKLGAGVSNFVDLYTDVPLKTTYVFKGVLLKVAEIKLLPFPYRNATGSILGTVEFRNLPITWK